MYVQVETVPTVELGDRSYVVHDGTYAFVIDPQRDVDRVTEVLDRLGLQLAAVAETHIHNDYLTGGLVLARAAKVEYLVSRSDDVSYARTPVDDDTELSVGDLFIRVVATPGHTQGHLSYVVLGPDGSTAVFSGGSLLYGAVGRTDLISTELTHELAIAQYRSVRRLADSLPDDAALYPTHGFGSFCASGPPSPQTAEVGTVGAERRNNQALVEPDEVEFVRRTIAGFTPYPAYYPRMAPRNAAGVEAADLSAGRQAELDEIRQRLDAGEWVVDLRSRRDFAADHLAGTIAVELGPQFATYLGWIFPYGSPLALLGETAEQVAAAQRQLVRIGIDRPSAVAHGPLSAIAPGVPRGSFRRASFAELAEAINEGVAVLDVRRQDERERDGAIPRALHMPLPELMKRLDDLPESNWWVHCASGFRATIAASLLDRAGHRVVLVDDSFASAREHGLVASP
ncbi:MAG TPA: MBL fold metallo-hydrolase [Mycobacteriales bacterium]|jgi:glyoxylase-like metal-dependent hydrolase (beta-lactamase superfamily II)/rhodanese-related sulfurtransferase|nr:MBL fold metallo-hydrolase [Mycobacteriales bacterium]